MAIARVGAPTDMGRRTAPEEVGHAQRGGREVLRVLCRNPALVVPRPTRSHRCCTDVLHNYYPLLFEETNLASFVQQSTSSSCAA